MQALPAAVCDNGLPGAAHNPGQHLLYGGDFAQREGRLPASRPECRKGSRDAITGGRQGRLARVSGKYIGCFDASHIEFEANGYLGHMVVTGGRELVGVSRICDITPSHSRCSSAFTEAMLLIASNVDTTAWECVW